MTVLPCRMVTDRWEWASLSQLAPTVYHEQPWTLATTARLRGQSSQPVAFGYARIWSGDTLIGCPLIRHGDHWFNTPRACPLVLRGPHLDAAALLLQYRPHVELHDDSRMVKAIDRTRLALDLAATSTRRYLSISTREFEAIATTLTFGSTRIKVDWLHGFKTMWNSGSWTTELRAHLDHTDAPIGWTQWVTRPRAPAECVAAARVDQRVPAWTVTR